MRLNSIQILSCSFHQLCCFGRYYSSLFTREARVNLHLQYVVSGLTTLIDKQASL